MCGHGSSEYCLFLETVIGSGKAYDAGKDNQRFLKDFLGWAFTQATNLGRQLCFVVGRKSAWMMIKP